MRNLFLIGMLAGLGFVYFGLQQATTAPKTIDENAGHDHAAEEPARVAANEAGSQSAAIATATRVFDVEHPGYQVYVEKGCQRCHGGDLLGTRLGPALVDARRSFDLPALGEYLADPASYIEKDARLKALDQKYRMQQMPATVLSDEELHRLGGLILGRDS